MRGAWGRKVAVSGLIGRDPEQGRPVVVRHITKVDILDDSSSGSYHNARGVFLTKKEVKNQRSSSGVYAMPGKLQFIYWDSCVFLSYINADPGQN